MPRVQTSLYLHEEIMLLALRDEQGTVEYGTNYVYAMCGGILAELLLAGRITVEDNRKKLVNGDLMGKATKEAIEAAQAAVMVACVMPAVMVATMSH